MQQLHTTARTLGVPLAEATVLLCGTDELKPKLRQTLRQLMTDLARWRDRMATLHHTDLARVILDESGYTAMWQADRSPEAPGRLENLKELVAALADFENLQGFLEHVALVMDANEQAPGDQVTLMTLHGAKGLEFDVVFLPGWEEGIFPSQRTLDESGIAGLEEERRLAYVGLTRARRLALVSHAANRRVYGTFQSTLPSRFVDEMPKAHLEIVADAGLFGGAHAATAPGFGGLYRAFNEMGTAHARTQQGRAAPRPAEGRIIEGRAFEVVQRPRPSAPFARGARVFHQKFGYGTVAVVEDDKLEIDFDVAGRKKVIDSFVKPAAEAG
jgi:DNA helicase-2/ATP-dependent DNA helicase PcrA